MAHDVTLDYHGQPVSPALLHTIVSDLQCDCGVDRVTAVLLPGCALSDADLMQLLPFLVKVRRLARLDVGDNRLTGVGVGLLADMLLAADRVLGPMADLRVAGNKQCGAQGLSLLAAALASNTTLTKLDVSAVAPIELSGDELALEALACVLQVHCCLLFLACSLCMELRFTFSVVV